MLPVALAILLATAAAANYCSLSSCPANSHTMCKYPDSGAAGACGTVHERGTSAADRAEILSAHNAIRQAVRSGQYASENLPAAAAMPDLVWDNELATVAQRWADQCASGHDQCRSVARFYVGQNLAWSWGGAKDWTNRAIGQWFHGELPNFQQSGLKFTSGRDPVSGGVIGHLTQVIWAGTTKVGCGYIAVQDDTWVKRTFACNYGPGGNIRNWNIYQAA
ncbi:venom allergen 5-like [Pollicipes pollicipes]|uniref:venom allergen 5-like n=1 Tax=Pollicipes pollicipes TaxID=41117 RepID=UPI0018850758|nr:venom allergen 5-like [Pollicipes pollicipes]